MVDGQNFFDQPIKIDQLTYDNIPKIATAQGDDYPTGFFTRLLLFKRTL